MKLYNECLKAVLLNEIMTDELPKNIQDDCSILRKVNEKTALWKYFDTLFRLNKYEIHELYHLYFNDDITAEEEIAVLEKLNIVREEQNMIGAWVGKARDKLESAKDVVPLCLKDVTTSKGGNFN